jgi:hypothetical protein
MYPKFPGKFVYKTVNIDDIPSANLKQHFVACHRFIEAALAEGGVVLVHCWAGVSRSATIVISYLMQKHNAPMMQCMEHVRAQRWFINPNPGFKNQMKRFEKELVTKDTAIAFSYQREEETKQARTIQANTHALPAIIDSYSSDSNKKMSSSATFASPSKPMVNATDYSTSKVAIPQASRLNTKSTPPLASPLTTKNLQALTEKPRDRKANEVGKEKLESPFATKGKSQRIGSVQPPSYSPIIKQSVGKFI